MMRLGAMIDVDHMREKTVVDTLDYRRAANYPCLPDTTPSGLLVETSVPMCSRRLRRFLTEVACLVSESRMV
jgi:hypothetical protein